MSISITVVTPTIRGDAGLNRPSRSLKQQTFKDFEWLIEKHDPMLPSDFNAASNRMIKKAQGELIVFLQDYISIPSTGLQQFWDRYQQNKEVFLTAPVGKTLDDIDISWDWRKNREDVDNLNFMEWEIDWAAAPKKALFAIGGFDEALDKYWGFDNVNIGLRAIRGGYIIQNVRENAAVAYDHNAVMDHPYQKIRNPDFHNERLQEIEMGAKVQFLENL